MAQASPQLQQQLQQFVRHLTDAVHFIWQFKTFRQIVRSLKQLKGWLLGLVGLLLLLLWNWQLVMSASVGLTAMVLVYLLQQGQWQWLKTDWQTLRQIIWSPANRSLTLAIGSGVVVSFSADLTISIWLESQGSWLGKGLILQGMGTLAIVLLLLWQRVEMDESDRPPSTAERFNQLLDELADTDPLKRLIAVKRLTQWAKEHWMRETDGIEPSTHLPSQAQPLMLPPTDLADCFRLMLNRETEPVVCRALIDSLQALTPDQQLPQRRNRLTQSKAEHLHLIEVGSPVAEFPALDSSGMIAIDASGTDSPATHP